MKIELPLACYFSVRLPEGGVENPPAETGQVLEKNGRKLYMWNQPQYTACLKDYLGTRSFPNTTDVTNSFEYSIASPLSLEEQKKRKS